MAISSFFFSFLAVFFFGVLFFVSKERDPALRSVRKRDPPLFVTKERTGPENYCPLPIPPPPLSSILFKKKRIKPGISREDGGWVTRESLRGTNRSPSAGEISVWGFLVFFLVL